MQPEDVYREHRVTIEKYLYRLCGNKALAEELTQETFYQAIKSWDRFKNQSGVTTWLCSIAKHLYWSMLRKKGFPVAEIKREAVQPDFVEQLILHDRAMTAHQMLHALKEPYREVFTLRTFCDMSHAEIGELFGKSEAWARVTYYRARQMLSEAFKEEESP